MMNSQRKHGFTLIEIILAMSLVGMLLAAVGAAMDASMNSYNENEKFSSATQLGRSILPGPGRWLPGQSGRHCL